MEDRAVVLLSGGQDSTTALFWARKKFKEVHAISFDYGQRHRAELDSASAIATLAGVASHRIVKLDGVLLSSSPLVDHATPLAEYTDAKSMAEAIGTNVEATFVPLRNELFLTIAANYAVSLGIATLVTGVCETDNANYPDCRKKFISAKAKSIREALGVEDFSILTPLIDKSKAETVKLAYSLDGCMDALAISHTCYAGEFPPCGKCHACVLRADGFARAHIIDPLIQRANGQI